MIALVSAWCALVVTVTPARLQIGAEHSPARVQVDGLPGERAHVRLWTSLGTLSEARAAGAGQLEALYQPPSTGAPAYAVVAAWDESSGEVGVATVELEARTEIPVETEPGAQVVVSVGGHRGSARADPKGHASALVWVPPGLRSARVTAQDAAGNATTAEVGLDVPVPDKVWLVPRGATSGEIARLYAFTLPPAVPEVRVSGAMTTVSTQPGVATVTVRGQGDAVVIATALEAQALSELHLGAPPAPPRVVGLGTAVFADPHDELGASIGPRFSGSFIDAAVTLEWRRRLGRSRFHLGLDAGVLYAAGAGGSASVRGGGGLLRAVGEARFFTSEKAAITLGVAIGGALVGEHRALSTGGDASSIDGGPSLGGQLGLIARLGPGLVTITVGFYYTPLLALDRAILDGGAISVGYRSMRF